MAKLHDLYKQEVIKKLMDQFHYKTVMKTLLLTWLQSPDRNP